MNFNGDPCLLGEQPGTIVSTVGADATSRFIELCCLFFRPFTPVRSHVALLIHVGLSDLYRPESYRRFVRPVAWCEGTYLLESSGMPYEVCLLSKRLVEGVQLHGLDHFDHVPGRVWVSRLKKPLTAAESTRLTERALNRIGEEYDTSAAVLTPGRILRALHHAFRWRKRRQQFCVETAGKLLDYAIGDRPGFPDIDPELMTPGEFVVATTGALYHKPVRVK